MISEATDFEGEYGIILRDYVKLQKEMNQLMDKHIELQNDHREVLNDHIELLKKIADNLNLNKDDE